MDSSNLSFEEKRWEEYKKNKLNNGSPRCAVVALRLQRYL